MRSATVPDHRQEEVPRPQPGLSRRASIIVMVASCIVAGYASLRFTRYHNRRAVMWWLHRHVLAPTGLSIGQSGWDRMMAALGYLHWVAVPLAVLLVWWVMKRLTAARWLTFRRFPLHCCQNCGYNLTGNVSGVCPECGVAIADAVADPERAAFLEGLLVAGILTVLTIGALAVLVSTTRPRDA